jgi:hypothetical protein
MPTTRVIQYRTTPEAADENERLIRAVFAELALKNHAGLRYSSFRLADGVSFVHVAEFEGDTNPLAESAAFAEFQSGIADRCEQGPEAVSATTLGTFRTWMADRD